MPGPTRQMAVKHEGQKVMPVGLGSQAISGGTLLVLQEDDNPSPRSEIMSVQIHYSPCLTILPTPLKSMCQKSDISLSGRF